MRLFNLVILSIIIVGINSCGKPSTQPDSFFVSFKATLNGAGETPANGSAATGTATATYNKSTQILIININFSGLTPTSIKLFKGAAGTTGTLVFTIPGSTSPVNYTSVALTSTQEADLLANLYYINIQSAAYTNGEIRGQLIKQ